jgi:serine phosphatase RsbU (regulator of sigma subunit)/integral membrane sensor domain MASE1
LAGSRLSVLVSVTVLYVLGALAAYDLFGALSIGVTFFPPAGLTFTAFLLLPRRSWPLVAAGIIVAETGVNLSKGHPLWWSLGWVLANLTEPVVGALVTCRMAPVFVLGRRFARAFLAGGLMAGPLCGAVIGAAVLAASGQAAGVGALGGIWVGDALGVLVIAPLLLVLVRPGDFVHHDTRLIDTVVITAITLAVSLAIVMVDALPIGYAAVPLLAVPAVRHSAREVAVAGVVVAGILTAATARGYGPWGRLSSDAAQSALVQQQMLLLVALGAAWLLKLEVGERIRAVTAAQVAEAELRDAHERARGQRYLQAMYAALGDLATASTTADVLAAVDDHARSVADSAGTVVATVTPSGNINVLAVTGSCAVGLAPGSSLDPAAGSALVASACTGRVVIGPLTASSGHDPPRARGHEIAVPISFGDRSAALGMARDPGATWTDADQIRALAFASIIGDALGRSARYEEDRRVAITLQHAIMPGAITPVDRIVVAGRYLPAASSLEVGGDWYDLIAQDDRQTATVVIGDVVGHSLTAAAAMGKLAAATRALSVAGHAPADLVECLDRVAAHTPDAPVTTMACVRVDLGAGLLRYSLAGHLPPLVRSPDGTVGRLDGALALPLGIDTSVVRPEAVIEAPSGTSLLLYTDGLVERRRMSIDDRLTRLEQAFAAIDPADPDSACDALVTAMLGDVRHEDDVALICLTITPRDPGDSQAAGTPA